MNKFKIDNLNDILNITLFYLLILNMGIIIYSLYGSYSFPYVFAVGEALILLCMYVFRRTIRKLLLYIVFHLIMLLTVFIIPLSLGDKITLVIFAAIMVIVDLVYWTKDTPEIFDSVPLPLVFMFVGYYAIAYYTEQPNIMILSYRLGLIFVAVALIRNFFKNAREFTYEKLGTDIPINTMIWKVFRPLFLAIIIVFLLLFILNSEKFADVVIILLEWVRNSLLKLIILFFRFLEKIGTENEVETIPFENFDENIGGVAPLWLEKLVNIMGYVVAAACIIIVVYLLAKGIYKWCRYFRNRGKYSRKEYEFANGKKEIVEKIVKENDNSIFDLFIKLSVKEKIRKLYGKKVKTIAKSTKEAINSCETPLERVNRISPNKNIDVENFPEFTNIYNIARYSNDDLSENEFIHMKKIY